MSVPQSFQRRHAANAERRSSNFAQRRADKNGPIVAEADQALIEGGIPQGRKEEAVVDIQTLLVFAIGPRHDVRGAEQRRLGDACQRAAAAPIIHQRFAEDVLANALNHQPLGLCTLRQVFRLDAKARKRSVGQADGKLINAIKRRMQLAQSGKEEGDETGPRRRRDR